MKNFSALLAVALLSLQPNLSALAKDPAAAVTDSKIITLEQATTDLQLEHKEAEPIFETQQVPDTCHRDVQHGTRQDCNTEYDHQCHTTTENQCHSEAYPVCNDVRQNVCNPVSYPACQNINRNQCDSVPRQVCESIQRNECHSVPVPVCEDVPTQVCENAPTQECHDTSVPVCESVPRSVCGTTQQCETVQDSVCHGDVCQTVPRRECKPVESCHQVSDSVCHNETRNSCTTVNHQSCHTENQRQCHNDSRQECHAVPDSVCHTVQDSVCHTVPDTVCHDETRQECHLETQNQCHDEYRQSCADVPVEHCQDIPRQVCETVPNTVSEPYACTRDVQVQTGERLKFHSLAQVKLVVSNFGAVDLSKESFKVALVDNDVVLSMAEASNKVIIRVVKKNQQVQVISEIEKAITTTFTLEAISLEQLSALSQIKMGSPVVYFDKISFKLEGADVSHLPLSFDRGHLKIIQKRKLFGHITVADQDFNGLLVKLVGDHYELDLQSLGIGTLRSSQTDVEISFSTKNVLNRSELLNPALIDQITFLPISGVFSGFPVSE